MKSLNKKINNQVKKYLILYFLSMAVTLMPSNLIAVQAVIDPVTLEQPDGTEITILVKGDERINWIETLDGYTLMRDSLRYVVFATKDNNGNLMPSRIRYYGEQTISRVQGAQQFLTSLQKGLFYSEAQVNTLRQIRATIGDESSKAFVTGQKKMLCILMEYPDLRMVNTPAQFNALMNQVGYSAGGATGSVRDYFLELAPYLAVRYAYA